jgi:deoxyhypusine synthase
LSRYSLFDWKQLLLAPIAGRQSDVRAERVARLGKSNECSAVGEACAVAAAIRQARMDGRPVVLMIGGHPIKLGLSRFLIDFLEKRFITCLATNGAGLIHDFELACMGETSEDLARWIRVDQFGLWQETGRLNEIAIGAASRGEGFGEAIDRTIEENSFPYRDISIAAAGWGCGVAVTCNVSIGSDIVHGYPNADRAALGAASDTDFLILRHISCVFVQSVVVF